MKTLRHKSVAAEDLSNIGTQSVQEFIFCESICRTVYSNDLVKFFSGCDVQQERNWEFLM